MSSRSIVIITNMCSNGWGGSEELWYDAAWQAKKEGYNIKVAAFFQESIHPKFKRLEEQGIETYFIKQEDKYGLLKRGIIKIKREVKGLEKVPNYYFEFLHWLKQANPEFIIISQGGTFNFVEFPVLLYMLESFRRPYFLISQHNHDHLTYSWPYLNRIRKYMQYVNGFFFVSERNLEVCKRQLAMKELPPMDTIKNPCKIHLDQPLPYPDAKKIKLGAVLRLDCKSKALDILIECFADDFFKEFEWELEVWGSGPDKTYLQELVSYCKLEKNIFFKGQTENIENVWAGCEILMLPSYNEGTPLSIMEALMCGRAALVIDVGDSEKLISDGYNGYLLAAPTKKIILEGIKRAFAEHASWKQMGLNGHNSVKLYIDRNPGKTLLEKINNML